MYIIPFHMKPGDRVWRIGQATAGKSHGAVRCIVVRVNLLHGFAEVRASTFSTQQRRVPISDLFADREACRAEIQRRNEKETTDGA